jgi:hypothetical protein
VKNSYHNFHSISWCCEYTIAIKFTNLVHLLLTLELSEQCREHLGCWKDRSYRAIGGSKTRVTSVKECQERAVREGNTVFAMQAKNECFTDSNAENTYKKYGISTKCRNGVGGPWSLDVYKLILCPGIVI